MLSLAAAALIVAQATPSPAASASPQPWTPAALWRVGSKIDAALQAPTLSGAHVAISVVDATTGAPLYSHGADDAMIPASTFKLIAGSAALATLGPDFAYVTDVDAAGRVEGGTLQGDLVLRGGGDAQLSPGDLDAAAVAVAAAGIQRVSGALVGDASRYNAAHYPPGWAVDDLAYEYAAVPSALSLDYNVAHVRAIGGDAFGDPAALQIDPQTDALHVVNATVTGARGSADTTDLERPWDQPWTTRVIGSYPLGAPLSDDLAPAVPDPPAYALDVFRRALERHGIAIEDGLRYEPAPAGATVVWTHHSKPLAQIVGDCWLPSSNLLAEQMLEELGVRPALALAQRYSDTRALGIAVEKTWLRSIGVDPATLTIADGSGLSVYDRITPRALVAILAADFSSSQRDTILADLPVAGVRGTLQSTFAGTQLQGVVTAKTGTVNHARLLAGYLQTRERGTAIFALMVDDWMDASPDASASLDAARSAMLTALLNG